MLGAVDADPDADLVLLDELGDLVRDQRAVALRADGRLPAGLLHLRLDVLDESLEESKVDEGLASRELDRERLRSGQSECFVDGRERAFGLKVRHVGTRLRKAVEAGEIALLRHENLDEVRVPE